MKTTRYIAVTLMAIMLVFLSIPASAQTASPADPNQAVDQVLCSMGLGCASTSTSTTTSSSSNTSNAGSTSASSTSNSGGGFFDFIFGSSNKNTHAVIYGATISKAYTNNLITLFRVARSDSVAGELKADEQVYEIIRGKKHLIPNLDIFMDYGFKPQQVQFVTQEQLNKYPSIKYIQQSGDKNKTTHYITNNGMRRTVLNQEVLESYGGRTEDIIVVSKKEFNFYPENKYIYLEQPFTGDVYLVDNGAKRYLTPMAVKRLGIQLNQLGSVNETEFNAYKIGKPVVF